MWTELKPTDNLDLYANFRNSYGCSVDFDGKKIEKYITKFTDGAFYFYEVEDFNILMGYRLNQEINKYMLLSFAVSNIREENYREALKQIAINIKDFLSDKTVGLYHTYDAKEVNQYNKTFYILKYENIMVILKEECNKIGLECFYDDYHLEVSIR